MTSLTYRSPVRNSSAELSITRHSHVQTSQSIGHATVLRLPVTHDETLEAKLSLEDAVHELRVLAPVRVVDLVVRAHERSDTSADGISKWPCVKFVQGTVIHVGGGGLGDVEAVAAGLPGLTEVLLLVGEPVLCPVSMAVASVKDGWRPTLAQAITF